MTNCRKCNKPCLCNIHMCDACIEAETIVVGSVTYTEDTEVSRMFESAAQYERVRIPAGEYPIVLGLSRFDGRRYVAVRIKGEVLSSGYGAKRYAERIGQTIEFSEQPYKYQLRDGWRNAKITDVENFERAGGV